jgi:hypothetical protein
VQAIACDLDSSEGNDFKLFWMKNHDKKEISNSILGVKVLREFDGDTTIKNLEKQELSLKLKE